MKWPLGGLAGGMGTLMCVSHFVFPLTRLDSREWSAVLLTLAKSTINETFRYEAPRAIVSVGMYIYTSGSWLFLK